MKSESTIRREARRLKGIADAVMVPAEERTAAEAAYYSLLWVLGETRSTPTVMLLQEIRAGRYSS